MILQKSIIIFFITLLSVQMFPFEWVGMLVDKHAGSKNINKLISLSATDEEETTEKEITNEQDKFIREECYVGAIVSIIEEDKYFSLYLESFISEFYNEILIPPPNING